MSIFINKDSKVIVQGITGGEGTKHTARMLACRHPDCRWRQRSQGRHHGVSTREAAATSSYPCSVQ